MRTVRLTTGEWAVEASSPSSFLERLRGLRDPRMGPNLLIGAKSVHTIGLGRGLEFVVIDRESTVVGSGTLGPNRVLVDRRAWFILELPEGAALPALSATVEINDV